MAGHVKPIPVPVILAAVNGDEKMLLLLSSLIIRSTFGLLPPDR